MTWINLGEVEDVSIEYRTHVGEQNRVTPLRSTGCISFKLRMRKPKKHRKLWLNRQRRLRRVLGL